MKVDLLIKNGRVVDTTQDKDCIQDMAVKNGRIIDITQQKNIEAARVLDATGCIVTPGLIDSHVHVFDRGCDLGIPADLVMLPYGVTTVGEGGSSGTANYLSCIDQLDKGRMNYRMLLNVSPAGLATFQYPEKVCPDLWDIDVFKKAFDFSAHRLMGLKLRISDEVVGKDGIQILEKVIELAEILNTRVCVHVTATSLNQGQLISMLRKNDIYCHVYQGFGETIIDKNGNLYTQIEEAKQRGVLFDAASGKNNFSFQVAKKAIEVGFLPDVICSDVSSMNYLAPYVGIGLPYIMSKFLALGLDLKTIIKMTTQNPAKLMGLEDVAGSLKNGYPADISIFKVMDGEFSFIDAHNSILNGTKMLAPVATVQRGDLVYKNILHFS